MAAACSAPGRTALRGLRPGQRRVRRGRVYAAAVCTALAVVLLGALSAGADPYPTPEPAPGPTATASPEPSPTAPPPNSPSPSPSSASSCAPSDCIPQPSTSAPAPAPGSGQTSPPALDSGGGPGGITGWIAKGVSAAISAFFKTIVTAALNPLLKLISDTLLTTPSLSSLPRVGELWANSWQIVIACYGILIALAGIVLMGYESVQTRYSVKEIGPRIPLAFLASGLSLFLAGKAVDLANALTHAVMGDGVDGATAGTALRDFAVGSFSVSGDLFIDIMWVVVIGVLVALLLTYVVRVALTVILVAGAPLALMCHALPQTDGIARWWWKAFGGVLAIQVAQSLTLITGVRVFLTPGGSGLFGGVKNGLVNLLVTLALMYILFKILFWILGSLRVSNRRSFAGSAVRSYAMYRTFGLLRGGGGGAGGSRGRGTPPRSGGGASPGPRGPRSGPPPVPPRRPGGPGRAAPGAARRPPGSPLFLQPTSGVAERDRPLGQASGPPPIATFRGPGDTAEPPPPRAAVRPSRTPSRTAFRAPNGTPAARTARRPTGPPSLPRFRQPYQSRTDRPRQATRPSAPATFRSPAPESGTAPIRRPPTSAPPPAMHNTPPAPRRPMPRAGGAPTGGDRR